MEDFIREMGGKSRYFPLSPSFLATHDLARVIRKPDNREYATVLMGVRCGLYLTLFRKYFFP
jgi:preprotein translocase subunit Sss1